MPKSQLIAALGRSMQVYLADPW